MTSKILLIPKVLIQFQPDLIYWLIVVAILVILKGIVEIGLLALVNAFSCIKVFISNTPLSIVSKCSYIHTLSELPFQY